MRSLSGRESHTTEESLLYRGREYASDRTKASAYVQEYAKISGHKSDKDSRKAVMDLRCLTRSTHTTPMKQMEEAFTTGELQSVLSQLKAGKAAGHDGLAPDLRRPEPSLAWSALHQLMQYLRNSSCPLF